MKKYSIIIILLLADLILKQLALQTSEDFFLIPKLFAFTLFKNPVLAFSLNFPQPLIISATLLILVFLLLLVFYKRQLLFPVSLIFIGSLSNLYDRLFYHSVIDYFFLYPISYFNLADLLIMFGIFYLGYELYKKDLCSHESKQ